MYNEEEFMKYYSLIKYVARSFVKKGIPEELYNDLIQEASLKLIASICNFDDKKASKKTYVWHCINGAMKKFIRKCYNESRFEPYLNDDMVDSESYFYKSPYDTYVNDELCDLLKHSICSELSGNEKMIINFYYFDLMSMGEISLYANKTIGRVSQIHTDALKKLKKKLAIGLNV